MDRYAVLVFRDQHDRRRAADRLQPPFRPAGTRPTGDIVQAQARRLAMEVNDISNLDRDN